MLDRRRVFAASSLFAVGLCATVALAEDAPTAWTPELQLQVKGVGNVTPSPDGSRVVFEVSEAVTEGETSEYRTHLWMVVGASGEPFQLTRGDESTTSATWSPDGQWVYFSSSRGGEKSNIFRINVNGGEAEKLTDLEGGLSGFQVSPDGKLMAITMSDPETDEEKAEKKEKRDARVIDDVFKYSHLYAFPIKADENGERPLRRLTEGEFNVSGGFGGGAFDWSPDGQFIAFSHTTTPKVDDWPTADISIVEVETGSVRPVIATGAAEGSPVFSPDGKTLAFTMSDDPPTWAFTSRVHLISPEGGETRALGATPDEQPSILGFAPDGRSVYVSENFHTLDRVYALPTKGSAPEPFGPENVMFGSPQLNSTATHLGYVSQTPSVAPEAYVTPLRAYQSRRISEVQDLPNVPLGRTEVISWESNDGTTVEGLLTYPADYQPGTSAPLLLVIHGGPTGVFQQTFIGYRYPYPVAAFAAQGYAVLRVNPRGSSGYGREFRYANYNDWGGGDYQDLMTGIDFVAEMGVADPDRLGVMGWSYGGFMTSWIITQTDRFVAASVGAGVTNLMSFTGTADIPGFIPDYFGGEPWEVFDAYREHSAMFNVGGVSTPTLIQHGENDVRVPVSQGYELYNALKRQDVPVKMIVYPRQPHGIREPKLILQAMDANVAWFNEWIGGSSASSED
jgi:dipeptidyl aminopeptidase/acylaminoacyl peptidase